MPEDQLVERLHELLSRALQQNRPRPFDSPVTVAEIYQDLVPYRSVRTALGFQMNADYEHTLLRLLAGENGLARLEPAEARDELQSELETPNPNVGLFRKFAACDVWVTPGAPVEVHAPVDVPASVQLQAQPEPAPAQPSPPPPAASEPDPAAWGGDPDVDPRTWSAEAEAEQDAAEEWDAALPELILEEEVSAPKAEEDVIPPAPAPEPLPAPQPPPAEPSHQTEATTMPEAAVSPAAITQTGSCAFCASDLPAGRNVKFCPFCGQDQSFRPCVACAEPLEPGWTFCIACGTRQGGA